MASSKFTQQKTLSNISLKSRDHLSSTFTDNMSLPIHRWYRYSAGFSAGWVKDVINQEIKNGRERVIDPFAGSGTVLLEAESCSIESIGVESHPFVARVARAKLNWRENPQEFQEKAKSILLQAKSNQDVIDDYPKLISKCFPEPTLKKLDSLRKSWEYNSDDSPISELIWLALASTLRSCSPVGTASWQYILPNKTKKNVRDPYEAFEDKILLMAKDMTTRQMEPIGPAGKLIEDNIITTPKVPTNWADLVITSPPYANNYDYADAARFEMSFFKEVKGWGDLQKLISPKLIRSCTQHVAKYKNSTFELIEDPVLTPIHDEIYEVCQKLNFERTQHGGNKSYHTMIATYFYDMAKMWINLRRITKNDALICFVVGDSAPYGIYAPVEKWLGELAINAGFNSFSFEITRKRNIKWKNRKHQVPLHEGRLWIEG